MNLAEFDLSCYTVQSGQTKSEKTKRNNGGPDCNVHYNESVSPSGDSATNSSMFIMWNYHWECVISLQFTQGPECCQSIAENTETGALASV